jgi:hypothetical protein
MKRTITTLIPIPLSFPFSNPPPNKNLTPQGQQIHKHIHRDTYTSTYKI